MALTVNQRTKFKITSQFVTVGVLLGIVYIFFEHGFSALFHYVNGAVVGFILGLLIALLELFVFARGGKRLKFIWLLGFRTLLYFVLVTVIIFNVAVVTQMILDDIGYVAAIKGDFIQEYLSSGRFLTAVILLKIKTYLSLRVWCELQTNLSFVCPI